MKKFISKINWKKLIKIVLILAVLIVIANVALNRIKRNMPVVSENTVETAKVEIKDITTVLSSSGTIKPLNTYEVTSLVEGEVVKADFEEGDQVEKGDVLYRIDTDSLDSKIDTAETSVDRAKSNYDNAVESYNKAVSRYQDAKEDLYDLSITSKASGMVTKIYVEKGDSVQAGSQLAEIYDNSSMLLSVPFNSSEVKNSWVGEKAVVEVGDFGETMHGTVTKIGGEESVLSGGRVVRYVTVKVKNPGGITTETKATASIGDIDCNSEGSFSVLEQATLLADKSGKISKINMKEGASVKKGDTIVGLSDELVSDQLQSYQDAIDNAKNSMENSENSIEDAKQSLDDQKESLSDYSITAPISGQVIRKDTLIGDTLKNSAQNSALCVIYDLSAVTFEMSIDELDVMDVKSGQEVVITADALEGEVFTGHITNISLESTTGNGVTQYPVTVRIDKAGSLLPGMNVTGKIVTGEAKAVPAVPVDALMRGDIVYVKDKTLSTQTPKKNEKTAAVQSEIPEGFHEVTVTTGLTDGDYIEITSGLSEGEEVYVKRNNSQQTIMMMPGMGGGVAVEAAPMERGQDMGGGPGH